MNSITRTLCQKYTDLTDDEITYIEQYTDMLQALANAEQADAFIDCRSFTGKTAIVVSEAKPQTVPSNYSIPILGMLINWGDEPAMERSFRLGIATSGMKAVSVPEGKRVIQTTEPLYYDSKLIGVLIYEKTASSPEEAFFSKLPEEAEPILEHGSGWLARCISEAVLIVGINDTVIACNDSARALYFRLGYVDDILGMPLSNIQFDTDEAFSSAGQSAESPSPAYREVKAASYDLRYCVVNLEKHNARFALVIQDITELRQQERQANLQSMAMREQRHRIKNNLLMLSNILRYQEKYADDLDARSVIGDTAGRLSALATTLDELVHVTDKTVSLRYVLEKVRANSLQSTVGPLQSVVIHIEGDDSQISANSASSVALVVNELLQNAIKYAFPAGRKGMITLSIENDFLFSRVCVSDNGIGFDPENARQNGMGFDIVRTIVGEKLGGELKIISGAGGTTVSFDFVN